MTKGRGDSTNSLETHVNLVQPLNKQSEYPQNGQICKFKIKPTYSSTLPPTPEQILVTVLSIKPFHLFHQNYLTPPSEFGINSFESWIPARRPFQTSFNSFSDQTLPPPTGDQYGLVNAYCNKLRSSHHPCCCCNHCNHHFLILITTIVITGPLTADTNMAKSMHTEISSGRQLRRSGVRSVTLTSN